MKTGRRNFLKTAGLVVMTPVASAITSGVKVANASGDAAPNEGGTPP